MFENFGEYFRGRKATLIQDVSGKPTARDVMIATGLFLLEMAGADNDYDPDETRVIFDVMAKQFRMDEEQVLEILELADVLRKDRSKLDDFFSSLLQVFSGEQREKVFAMVWKVVIADGRVDKFELRLATQYRHRLKLTDQQFENAKLMAESDKV